MQNWKTKVPDIAGHRVITDPSGPTVAFSDLNLPWQTRFYLATLKSSHFTHDAMRARKAPTYFKVSGWYHDPERSTEAKAETASQFAKAFPPGGGHQQLCETLAETYAQLASAWDRETIWLSARGNYHAKNDKAHTDIGADLVSIAYLVNLSTLFAPPDSYRGQVPRTYTPEGASGHPRREYHLTTEMRAALEGVPKRTIASWRGEVNPAVHLTPDFKGFRVITMAYAESGNRASALR